MPAYYDLLDISRCHDPWYHHKTQQENPMAWYTTHVQYMVIYEPWWW